MGGASSSSAGGAADVGKSNVGHEEQEDWRERRGKEGGFSRKPE